MNEIPTPRCDIEVRKMGALYAWVVPSDFARTLERELTTAREKLEATEKERDEFQSQLTSEWAIALERNTALAELAKVKAERDELAEINTEDYTEAGWNHAKEVESELSRLRVENAAKDGQLTNAKEILEHVTCDGRGREFFPFNLDGTMNEMFIRAIVFIKSTTPPVCVPVEVVAKLVEALKQVGPSRQFDRPCFCNTETSVFCVGHVRCKKANEVLALAAPFLAKGESLTATESKGEQSK